MRFATLAVRWCLALAVPAGFASQAYGTVTVNDRLRSTWSTLSISRGSPFSGWSSGLEHVYHDEDSGAGLLNSSGTGSMNDSATNTVPVLQGAGSALLATTLTFAQPNDLSGYTVSGSYASSFSTGTLEGYRPEYAGTEVYAQGVAGFNEAFSFVTTAPLPYSFSISQSNPVGTVIISARLFLDFNNDWTFNTTQGDVLVHDLVSGGSGAVTRTGVLPASPKPYRVMYSGNTYDETTSDGVTRNSSADYTASFQVVPEPGGIAVASAFAAAWACLRRRRSH